MKRKSRKSKSSENASNGVESRDDQNGSAETSDHEEDQDVEEPEDKRKKAGRRKSSTKKAEEKDEEEAYEVEQVLDEKNIRGIRHYLIRWKGYEPESDTWEPESTLNCAELISDYKLKQKKKNKSKTGKSKGHKESKSKESKETWDENENFEVDRILDVYFKRNGQREFLVSWKGYPQSQNSWEPEDNMDCKDLIQKFLSKVEKAKELEQRELRVHRTPTDRFTLHTEDQGRRLSKRNHGRQRIHYHDAE